MLVARADKSSSNGAGDMMTTMERVGQVFQLLREAVSSTTSTATLEVFSYLATHEGMSQTEVAKAMGLSLNTVNNQVLLLGPRARHKGKAVVGAELIEVVSDILDMRTKRIRLTIKGRTLCEQIHKIMTGS